MQQAQTTHETVQVLVDASNKIGDVVSLITDIAEQANLLALNAISKIILEVEEIATVIAAAVEE